MLEAFKQLHDSKKKGTQSLADVPVEHLAKVWTTKHQETSSEDHSHHSTRHEALTRSGDLVLARPFRRKRPFSPARPDVGSVSSAKKGRFDLFWVFAKWFAGSK